MKENDLLQSIYNTACMITEQMKDEGNPVLTMDQALEIIKIAEIRKINVFCAQLGSELSEIEADIDNNLIPDLALVASRINELERTLYDTLGSYKTGAALDALAQLPDVIKDCSDG